MQTKISLLGHFAIGKNASDGQTIKTRTITEELQKELGEDHVYITDTHGGWKTLLKAPFQAISALKHGDNVLIFPAHNGIRVYAPLLSLFRRGKIPGGKGHRISHSSLLQQRRDF